MKEKYTELELEVIEFRTEDVIVTSFTDGQPLDCPEHHDVCFSADT